MPSSDGRFATHDTFEEVVDRHLSEAGFLIGQTEYVRSMPELADPLKTTHSLSSLYIRHRPDRFAFIPGHPESTFLYDCKTCRGHNVAIEATALAFHFSVASLGVRFLYCCRLLADGHVADMGFWLHELDIGRLSKGGTRSDVCLMIPPARQYPSELMNDIKDMCKRLWPTIEVARLEKETYGSNTPYILIRKPIVQTWRDWRELVDELKASVAPGDPRVTPAAQALLPRRP